MPCVLVVDDERGARESLRLILEPEFEVRTAEDGKRGLEVLRRGGIEVVILDLRMPGWSGIETLLEMRDVSPHVGVVIVTGYGSRVEALEALRLDAYDLVTKPFDTKQVIDAVRRAAGKFREGRRRSRRRVSPTFQAFCEPQEAPPPRATAALRESPRGNQRPSSEEREIGLLWAIFDDGIQTYCREILRGATSSLEYREAEWWIFRSPAEALTSFRSLCELFEIDPTRMRRALEQLREAPDAALAERLLRHSA